MFDIETKIGLSSLIITKTRGIKFVFKTSAEFESIFELVASKNNMNYFRI